MEILNLFAGIGGNRKFWVGHPVTAVEQDAKIARLYQRLYPQDTVIVGDAQEYLEKMGYKYDYVWASPPCQSHSRINRSRRIKPPIDPMLHQIIHFLREIYKGAWTVENVRPYYKVDNLPTYVIDRHCFWSNHEIPLIPTFPKVKGLFGHSTLETKHVLHDYLGIHFDDVIYCGQNHCPAQILRNAVHPDIGKFILEEVLKNIG